MKLPPTGNPAPSTMYLSMNNRAKFRTSYWTECRDIFHSYIVSHSTNEFYFYHKTWESGVKRVRDVEKMMGLKEPAEFYQTKTLNCIYVKMGSFWSANSLRQSVFSAILKSRKKYFAGDKPQKLLKLFIDGYHVPSIKYTESDGFLENLKTKEPKELVKKG